MMTPLPVPSHRRLQLTWRAVIRTKEKPSFPVPEEEQKCKELRYIWIRDRKRKISIEKYKTPNSRKLIKTMNQVLGSFMSQTSDFTLEKYKV